MAQISYQDRDSGRTAHAVLFGPTNTKKTAWLTVEQAHLVAALQAWKDGDPIDPGLVDRVEAILRARFRGRSVIRRPRNQVVHYSRRYGRPPQR